MKTKQCPICSKNFDPGPPSLKRIYCGLTCKHEGQRQKLRTGKPKQCPVCDMEFYVSPSKTRRCCSLKCSKEWTLLTKPICIVCGRPCNTGTRYCSMWCMSQSYKIRLRGPDNPNWKGGPDQRINSGVPQWLRMEVLKRDACTCQDCGVQCGNQLLHLHHIQPWINEKTRYDPENLETLCFSCHWIGKHGYKFNETMRNFARKTGCGIKYLDPAG